MNVYIRKNTSYYHPIIYVLKKNEKMSIFRKLYDWTLDQSSKKYNFKFVSHLLPNDEHTMSQETITLFQNFIKKNI